MSVIRNGQTPNLVSEGFDWYWYYAFQQVGDQTVEEMSQKLREGVAIRESRHGISLARLTAVAG